MPDYDGVCKRCHMVTVSGYCIGCMSKEIAELREFVQLIVSYKGMMVKGDDAKRAMDLLNKWKI